MSALVNKANEYLISVEEKGLPVESLAVIGLLGVLLAAGCKKRSSEDPADTVCPTSQKWLGAIEAAFAIMLVVGILFAVHKRRQTQT